MRRRATDFDTTNPDFQKDIWRLYAHRRASTQWGRIILEAPLIAARLARQIVQLRPHRLPKAAREPARIIEVGEGALMSFSRFAALPALILAALCSVAAADDAPIDLHVAAPAPKPKPVKDAKSTTKPAITSAEAVRRANAYFESAQVMTADFVQVGPDGHRAEGKLTIARPGRMRFQFAPPDKLEIVADGRSVAVRDQKLDTQDLYLIGQTPLKFLLSEHIDLAKDTQVLNVDVTDTAVSILIEDKATLGGSAQINLVFDPANFALKQWTVNDAQGFQTVVTLFNIDLTAKPDEALFKIDEQRMIGQKR
jgi:outer membrane lipoprotein-sorting protein